MDETQRRVCIQRHKGRAKRVGNQQRRASGGSIRCLTEPANERPGCQQQTVPLQRPTVKPLYKDPGYKDNLTSKDVTISPRKFLQADKDNLHIRIILKNLGPKF